jgi:hypothetical protein
MNQRVGDLNSGEVPQRRLGIRGSIAGSVAVVLSLVTVAAGVKAKGEDNLQINRIFHGQIVDDEGTEADYQVGFSKQCEENGTRPATLHLKAGRIIINKVNDNQGPIGSPIPSESVPQSQDTCDDTWVAFTQDRFGPNGLAAYIRRQVHAYEDEADPVAARNYSILFSSAAQRRVEDIALPRIEADQLAR